jgi:hypothetical protein
MIHDEGHEDHEGKKSKNYIFFELRALRGEIRFSRRDNTKEIFRAKPAKTATKNAFRNLAFLAALARVR